MTIWSRLLSIVAFSSTPVTVLTLLTYSAIFISTIWVHESLPNSPRPNKQFGLNLDVAYRDLQEITRYPHPYNSHQNDVVRNYILDRVLSVSHGRDYVHVADDLKSNATFQEQNTVVYFEGTNVLVKIDGINSNAEGGVLFSAHYDSVSTAPGATDNGMGVATLLNLVDYFSENRPERTIIFNLNNGEEDWLNGAHTFLEHPWASIPTVFLNLEGAGNGGYPILFRTSSTGVTSAFRNVKMPHGSQLISDAFKRGAVRSGTDFTVYGPAGYKGLDLAFFRKRSRYHTKYDSVSALDGKQSLWIMMENSLHAGQALIALPESQKVQDDNTVYFDIYGKAFFVVTAKTMLIINSIILALGPIAAISFLVFLKRQERLLWTRDWSAWLRFPLAFVVGLGVTIGSVFLYAKLATYSVYSSHYLVVFSFLSAIYLGMYVILRAMSWWKPHPSTETAQRGLVHFQCYLLWWALLVVDNVALNALQVGGLYFFTFFNLGSFTALLIAMAEMYFAYEYHKTVGKPTTEEHHNGVEHPVQEDDDAVATERTPLIPPLVDVTMVRDSHWTMFLWGAELLVSSVFPVILVAQLLLLCAEATSQTLSDGNLPASVYGTIGAFCFLIVVPLAPFMHKIHKWVAFVIAIVLTFTILHNLLAFPFHTESPLKIYFQQTIDLEQKPSLRNNTVQLIGVSRYVQKALEAIPTGQDAQLRGLVDCSPITNLKRRGLTSCRYPSLAPNVGATAPRAEDSASSADLAADMRSDLISFNTTRLTANTGTITVTGYNTRSCRIYFDDAVHSVRVNGGNDQMQTHFPMTPDGSKEIRLWSRTWNRTFEVLVEWEGKTEAEPITGRVSCNWAEMREGTIPALDEVYNFLPTWAVMSKNQDGLVEGYKRYEM